MAWKAGFAIAVGSMLLAGTALAQAPGGSGGSGTGAPGAPGGAMTPTTPGTGTNPCPPGQTMEGKTCAPSRVQGDQSSPRPMERSMEKQPRPMEKMDRQVRAQNGADKQQLKMAQEALKEKGYDPGAIDGAMGPRTSGALRDFQQAEGLRATGRLDAETRSKLGI
jgi:hypothetical protein